MTDRSCKFVTLERRWFIQFCVGILVATANGACFTFGIFSPYLKMGSFRYTQSELNLVSTVGVVLSYFSLPTGFLYDNYGPRVVLLVGSVLNFVGWIGMYVIFYDMQHPLLSRNVLVMSLFYGVSQFSASFYEQGCILTNLKAFSCYRGRVVVIQKTFMGLGSALAAQLYALFFAHNTNSISGFFVLLAAFSVVVGVLSVYFTELPTSRTRCLGLNVLEATAQARRTGQSSLFNQPFQLGTVLLIASVAVILTSALLEGVTDMTSSARWVFWSITVIIYLSFSLMIVVTPCYPENVGGYRGAVVQDEHGDVYGAEGRGSEEDEEAIPMTQMRKEEAGAAGEESRSSTDGGGGKVARGVDATNSHSVSSRPRGRGIIHNNNIDNDNNHTKDRYKIGSEDVENDNHVCVDAGRSNALHRVTNMDDSTTHAGAMTGQARGVTSDYCSTTPCAPSSASLPGSEAAIVLDERQSKKKTEEEEDSNRVRPSAASTGTGKDSASSTRPSPSLRVHRHAHHVSPHEIVVTTLNATATTWGTEEGNTNTKRHDEKDRQDDHKQEGEDCVGVPRATMHDHVACVDVTSAAKKAVTGEEEDERTRVRVVPSSILTSSFEERTFILNGHSLWENMHHRDLWMLWFVCFAAWSTMTLVFSNSGQIYQSLAVDKFSLVINSVYVSLLGTGSALGRIAVGLVLPILQQRHIPLTFLLLFAPIFNVGGLLMFLVAPLSLLFLPFCLIGLATGVSWGITVLVITNLFEPNNCGKHYSMLYTAGMLSPLVFDTGMFGPIYDYYSAQQHRTEDHTCHGVVCIYIPLIVCTAINFIAVFVGYFFMIRTETRRGIVITPASRALPE